MAFALSVIRLEEALNKPGCAVCRLAHETAIHSMDSFLWENSNDPVVGQKIQAAYGFCPPHTQMLAAIDLATSGSVLGVNQVYARVAKKTIQNLQGSLKTARRGKGLSLMLEKLGLPAARRGGDPPLTPQANCPVCDQVEISTRNTISTMCEELESGNQAFRQIYAQSSGVCLLHLRASVFHYGNAFPKAAEYLFADCSQRLETQRANMMEYIRKQNYEYQDEEVTSEESSAWRKVLTFFTGYPGDKFSHHIEKF